ncbi:MAG: PilZ domain-containing protein [Terriglobia bacterium]|nr:PilZ domain-containing protein [Terriglobia bacterium]
MSAIPAWHQVCRRAFTRVRFVTAVHIESGGRSLEGASVNVSLGGMLIASKNHPFRPLDRVLLTFEVEKGFFAELPAQVIHARKGEYFGVRWLDLPMEYAQILTRRTTVPAISQRRSQRLAQRFFLELKWQDNLHERIEPAETVLISKHGCLLLTRSDIPVGNHVQLSWREKNLSSAARVAYSEPSLDGDLNKIALEFETANELWGQTFSE